MNRERQEMKALLQQLPAGPVAQTSQLESALASCWHTILGGDTGGMDGYKLRHRMEQPRWEPPILKFRVERHGSTVCGSTRAEIQQWEIDTNRWTASFTEAGHRQLKKMAPRVDVRPLAAEVCELILKGKPDHRLKWTGTNRVQVLIGKVIPDEGFKATVTGRRKRLKNLLKVMLEPAGWFCVAPNKYERRSLKQDTTR